MENNFRGFLEDLKESVAQDNSEHKEITKYVPRFFELLCDVIVDNRSDWNTRLIISSALSYFVMPEDIIPDGEEGLGFIDDLYITSFVLKKILEDIDPELVIENWHEEENIIKLVNNIYTKSQVILGERCPQVLELVGLRKYLSADFGYAKNNYPERMVRLVDERNELIGLLAFILAKLYDISRDKNVEHLKKVLRDNENYSEILKIINLAKKKGISKTAESVPDDNSIIDRKLRMKRIKRILEEK